MKKTKQKKPTTGKKKEKLETHFLGEKIFDSNARAYLQTYIQHIRFGATGNYSVGILEDEWQKLSKQKRKELELRIEAYLKGFSDGRAVYEVDTSMDYYDCSVCGSVF